MKRPKEALIKFILFIFLAVQFTGFFFLFPAKLQSANLTSISDTLSNNRLSFRGQVNGNHAATSSIIVLQTTPGSMGSTNTSTGSASLMGNESVQVGTNNAPLVLKTIESDSRIVLASPGITNAVNDAAPVFASSSAVHTVRFTPLQLENGAFRALIPAASANNNDGIPDKNGFDFPNAGAPTVACTGGGSNFTFQTGTATAAAITVSTQVFHSFECRYNGTGASPSEVTMIIGTAGGNKLINPSPADATTHNPGQADSYTFRVRQTEGTAGSYVVANESLGKLGIIEAVRVTATVAPILTFTLTGVTADSGSYCGVSRSGTSPDSTVQSVPFGSISTTAFTDAAQLLTVSTNAAGGYSVTASESAALTAWNITGTPTIANTTCDAGTCTASATTALEWNTATNKGFGYSLQDVSGNAVSATLEYNTGGASFASRPFGSTAAQIMSDTTTADADQAYVCYRVVVSGSQQAGDYENYVIYIATATF